jgi:serine kinase of HPr protein (carbohydrate metabolism regulator)
VTATIHASAVLIGAKAALIRGPSGSGKSRLAWALIEAARSGTLPFARLVADDRAHLEVHAGGLLVRPAEPLAGFIEIRGIGIRRLVHEWVAVVGLVIDLAAADGGRLPELETGRVTVEGIALPRLAVASGMQPLPLVLAWAHTQIGSAD